jgi:hypothetical protein
MLGPTGRTLRDNSKLNQNGTMVATMAPSTGWEPSRGKYSAKFDGTDDYFDSIGSLSSFAFIQNTMIFGISWWQKISSLTVRMSPIGNEPASANKGFLIVNEYGAGLGTNALRISIYNGSGGGSATSTIVARTPDSVLTTEWQHCMIVGVGDNVRIYINGVLQSLTYERTFNVLSTGDSTRTLNVGRTNHSSTIIPMNGLIDDVMIFNQTPPEATVKRLATCRGIAYEMAPRRRSRAAVITSGFSALRPSILRGSR